MMPIKGGQITAPFNEPRPLSSKLKTHVHGALDIAGGDGLVRAPVSGLGRAYVFFRPGPDTTWPQDEKAEIQAIAFRNYFYDIYGAIIAIAADDGTLHLLCHCYATAIINSQGGRPFLFDRYVESKAPTRFPLTMLVSNGSHLSAGQVIAKVGSAGQSTGAHVHWEVHHSPAKLDTYAERINPDRYI